MKIIYVFFLAVLLLCLTAPTPAQAETVIAIGEGKFTYGNQEKAIEWYMVIYGDKSVEFNFKTSLQETEYDEFYNVILENGDICGCSISPDYTTLEFCVLNNMPGDLNELRDTVNNLLKKLSSFSLFKDLSITLTAPEWPLPPERKENNGIISRGNNFC